MAYIGNPPITGNFQVCDAISVVNGQAAYTMQVDSVNVVPESANHMLVSLNGILQKPNSSFTVSSSTITFASNLATGDVIDFIILLGNVLDLGVPSDATVTNAKTNFTSTSSAAGLQIKGDGTTDGTLQLNCSQNSHGIKLASPAHSAGQSYTLTFPTGNVTADKYLKVASVSGSGTTGVGQLSFDDAGGGQKTLLSTTTVSSAVAQIDITSNIDSTYARYEIIVDNFSCATNSAHLYFRIFQSGGISSSSNYDWVYYYGQHNDSSFNGYARGLAQTEIKLLDEVSNDADKPAYLTVTLYDPSNTSIQKKFDSYNVYSRGDNINSFRASGRQRETNAVTGVRFYMSSGNIDGGVFKLYGIT